MQDVTPRDCRDAMACLGDYAAAAKRSSAGSTLTQTTLLRVTLA